jgi:uncharacterized membrane protein
MDGPDIWWTAGGVLAALILGGVANWQLRKPAHQRIWPVVPWLGVQFVTALVFLVLAAHLVTLLTGRHFDSRNGGY